MRNIVGLKEKWLFYKGLGDVNGEREGGEEIVLPAVNTKNGETYSTNDQEIIEKNWWEY